MAESTNNVVMHGARGLVGKMIVFSIRAGKTIISDRPKRSTKPPTENQLAVREKFRDAITYATAANTDPVTKELYLAKAKPGVSAFNVAAADFLFAPDIKELITTGYNGDVGSSIVVKAIDDFKVDRVHVVIKTAAGVIVEQGNALIQANGLDWKFTATVDNPSVNGCTVTATAYDLPGNSFTTNKTI